jgi:hypothetical protein
LGEGVRWQLLNLYALTRRFAPPSPPGRGLIWRTFEVSIP